MITKSPYHFGYGHSAYRAGAEPDKPFVHQFVPTNDPKEVVDFCLNCTAPHCDGVCNRMPEAQRTLKYKARKKRQDEIERDKARHELAVALQQKERETAATVAKMILDGWRESAIARELGLTVQEVKDAIELAHKRRWLY